MPFFALTAYAKNERADLSQQDRNGRIPEYQARQLIAMFEKYGDDNG